MYSKYSKSDFSETGSLEINVIPATNKLNYSFKSKPEVFDDHHEIEDENDSLIAFKDIPVSGSLLCGSIFGCRNVPNVDSEYKCFFRVLYAETGGKSSLLSARTPIFTSDLVFMDDELAWPSNNSFQLNIPSAASDLLGEVIVALYRSKNQGGNESIGQIVFNLASLYENGTVELRYPGSESRILNGTYPLVTRQLTSTEISLRFELIWRKDNKIIPNSEPVKLSKLPEPDVDMLSRHSSSSRLTKSQSTTSRPTSAGRSTSREAHPVRKIASAGLKKKREDSLRIERENKIMQSKLLRFATSKNQDAATPKPYVSANKGADRPKSNETKPLVSDKDLIDQLTKIKQQIIDKTVENSTLKGQINQLKSQASKMQRTNERIKKSLVDCDPKSDFVGSSKNNVKESFVKQASERSDRSWIFREYGLEEETIMDKELFDIIDEHFILQNMRRNLIYRIGSAKQVTEKNLTSNNVLEQNRHEFIDRLKAWFPEYISVLFCETSSKLPDQNKEIVEVYNCYLKAQYEYLEALAINQHGLYTTRLSSKIVEAQAVYENLQEIKNSIKRDIDGSKYERDLWQERLHNIIQSKVSQRLKESWISLKKIQLKLDREQRIASLLTNSS